MPTFLSRRSRSKAFVRLGGMLGAFVLAACSSADRIGAPLTPLAGSADWAEGDLAGYVRVCKLAGPIGSYIFNISVEGGGDHILQLGPQTTITFEGDTVCAGMYSPFLNSSWEEGETAQITVSETVPAGMFVEEIKVYEIAVNFPGYLYSVYNTNTVTVTFNPTDRVKLYFINAQTPPPPPPPPSGEGCTPGYWKQSQHFDSWVPTGLTPTQTVASVFANASIYGLGGFTLVEGLSFKGGSTLQGAAEVLLRAAIAAQLNAGHSDVGAPTSAADMVNAVNAALASGNRETILTLATQLDNNNNLGCFLN